MRILLVDDDNSISEAVVAVLTKQNHYIVDVAADGQMVGNWQRHLATI
jgi:DNA-binding response OmpR family regulator